MTQNNEREAFELNYAHKWQKASENARQYSIEHLCKELKEMREGENYGEDRDYLNFTWEGWQARAQSSISQNEQQPKQIPEVTSYDLASEEDETVYWLQSDIQKKGWGPFKTEIDAWKYLFGREPSEEEIAEYKNADWYVGFINAAPTNTEVGND